MKSFVCTAMFAAWFLIAPPASRAQDCSSWTNFDLRGTYTMTGSGWVDLSKVVPGLPAGSIPMSWAGAHSYNGAGGGTGWVSLNAGGVQISVDLLNLTYQMKPDCSVAVSFSMKLKELGVTVGPLSRILVVSGSPAALELKGILAGAGPGMPVDLMTSHRVSMQFK